MSQHFVEFVKEFFPVGACTTQTYSQSVQPRAVQPRVQQPRVLSRRQSLPNKASAPRPRTTSGVYEMTERDRQVAKQKSTALRENPRLFQRETMLYVSAIISGYKMPLFVDTGAQASVMSMKTCKSLGLVGIVDVSQAGVATGVGVSRIYGKLWRVPVQIGRIKFHMQFNILDMGVNVILGLDQMKRLGMNVDLKRGGLLIGNSLIPFTQPPAEDGNELVQCHANTCAVM
jgi:hypothetical protein